MNNSQKIISLTSKIGLTFLVLNVAFIAYLASQLNNSQGLALETFKEIRNTSYFVYIVLFIISGIFIALNKIPKYILGFLVVNLILTTYAYFLATILAGSLN